MLAERIKAMDDALCAEFPNVNKLSIHILSCKFNDIDKVREFLHNHPDYK